MTHHPLYVGKRMSNERGYRISLSYETSETSQGTIQDKTILQLKVRRCKITLALLLSGVRRCKITLALLLSGVSLV